MWLLPGSMVPCETAAVSARSVYTIKPCTVSRHFMQNHVRKVHACLAVTWHLHLFWQNDRDPIHTAVTLGWNGYRNKSQHRKLTLEKTIIPPLLAEWPALLTCYCGNTGSGTDTEIRDSTESWPWRRKFVNRSCRDSNLGPFSYESVALNTQLSPLLGKAWNNSPQLQLNC